MRNTFKTLLLALPLCLAALSAQAADGAAGRWKTIDDKTGKVKSIVEITQAHPMKGTISMTAFHHETRTNVSPAASVSESDPSD